MSIGSVLREARERKGLTIAEVAERTRMIHQMVEEMENDDFHRVSAAIYGRGFIKLYSECVEVDPAPLLEEFNEVYTGFRKAPPEGEPATHRKKQDHAKGTADKGLPEKAAVTVDDAKTVQKTAPKAKEEPVVEPPPKAYVAETPTHTSQVAESKVDEALPVQPASSATPAAEAPVAEEPAVVKEPAAESQVPVTPEVKTEDAAHTPTANVAAALGELFDVERRRRDEAMLEDAAQRKHEETSHLDIRVTEEAPSWDDAPLGEGGLLHRMIERLNVKVALVAAAAIFVCAIIIGTFALSAKPGATPEPVDDQSQTTSSSDSAPTEAFDPYTTPFAPPPDTYVE